jgi:hypothetical protein
VWFTMIWQLNKYSAESRYFAPARAVGTHHWFEQSMNVHNWPKLCKNTDERRDF